MTPPRLAALLLLLACGSEDARATMQGRPAPWLQSESRGAGAASAPPVGAWGDLVAGVWDRDLGGGLRLDAIDVRSHEVTLLLRRAPGDVVARVFLRHPAGRGHRTASLAVALQAPFSQARTPQEVAVLEAIATVVREVAAHDPGGLGQQLSAPEASRWLDSRLAWAWLGIPAALLAAAAVVQALRGRPLATRIEVRANHMVPAALQCAIYAYWTVYVSRVGERLVDIAAQLVFAYVFDALLSLGRGRPWRPGLGPLPIVLSTNLFVWFAEPWLQCSVMAIALGSREFILRGRGHVFNPSALGISVMALLTIAVPTVFSWGTPTPDIEMNLPPNMAELILCLALVAQLRFPIAMVPLGATLGLRMLQWRSLPTPNATWPATLLILVLFATDPKTLPKTVMGRFLFGLSFGCAIGALSLALKAIGQPDDYAKVLPIPLLNLLAPQLDRAGAALFSMWRDAGRHPIAAMLIAAVVLTACLGDVVLVLVLVALAAILVRRNANAEPRIDPVTPGFGAAANRAAIACWLLLAVTGIARQKAASFQAMGHFENGTPRIVVRAGVFPTCAENPAWCKPFSVPAEVRAWWQEKQP